MENRINGAIPPGDGTPPGDGKKAGVKKTPATQLEWLAAHLHQAREDVKVLRSNIVGRDKKLLAQEQTILLLRQKVLDYESQDADRQNAKADTENAALRDAYKLVLGRELKKEDDGSMFWIEPPEKTAK